MKEEGIDDMYLVERGVRAGSTTSFSIGRNRHNK